MSRAAVLCVFFLALLHFGAGRPTSEQDIPSQIVTILSALTQKEFGHGNPWLRQAHAKQHGCVQATVQVLPNLPAHLAQGTYFDDNFSVNHYDFF